MYWINKSFKACLYSGVRTSKLISHFKDFLKHHEAYSTRRIAMRHTYGFCVVESISIRDLLGASLVNSITKSTLDFLRTPPPPPRHSLNRRVFNSFSDYSLVSNFYKGPPPKLLLSILSSSLPIHFFRTSINIHWQLQPAANTYLSVSFLIIISRHDWIRHTDLLRYVAKPIY